MVCENHNQVPPEAVAALESFLQYQGINVAAHLVELGNQKLTNTPMTSRGMKNVISSFQNDGDPTERLSWAAELVAVGIPSEMKSQLEEYGPSWAHSFTVATITRVSLGHPDSEVDDYIEDENGGLRMTICVTGTVPAGQLDSFLMAGLTKLQPLLASHIAALLCSRLTSDLKEDLNFSVLES